MFRPVPPALDSAVFARDMLETRTYGSKAGTVRTPEQTIVAAYYETPGNPAYNGIARDLESKAHHDLLDSARAFALLNMALCDGQIAVFDAKHTYNRLRPVTAIAQGGAFYGHPEIAPDASWASLIAPTAAPRIPVRALRHR